MKNEKCIECGEREPADSFKVCIPCLEKIAKYNEQVTLVNAYTDSVPYYCRCWTEETERYFMQKPQSSLKKVLKKLFSCIILYRERK